MEVVRELPPRPSAREAAVAVGMIVGVNVIGSSPSLFIGSDTSWFSEPWFFPPGIVFGVAWTTLFTLMGLALYLVWRHGTSRRDVRLAIAIFAVQLVVNVSWTPAFFGLQRADLGLLVIGVLWVAVAATIWAFARVDRLAAALLAPYLAWVSFAAVLNYTIYAG
ncbi:TspO and MBR-like protein [Natrialba hulunbeirensis JCM 10989]|uniref:TspO and MBR-like protein n=1 Tax=Natrialba hulunbeirensis JCM 10989 TaxID=1227493 RepID=M0A403_9EURY|nr:TspO/MBR family protein [Natrialba hulunbeirensis]ELY93475.1 TspO and MBR-like protein [Natrialba hulunbeirensis JCM 10989]